MILNYQRKSNIVLNCLPDRNLEKVDYFLEFITLVELHNLLSTLETLKFFLRSKLQSHLFVIKKEFFFGARCKITNISEIRLIKCIKILWCLRMHFCTYLLRAIIHCFIWLTFVTLAIRQQINILYFRPSIVYFTIIF